MPEHFVSGLFAGAAAFIIGYLMTSVVKYIRDERKRKARLAEWRRPDPPKNKGRHP